MSERFKIVSEQTYENLLFHGFPVIPEKSRITYDNQTSKIVVQFKLMNICSDFVNTVYIRADFYDVANEVVASVDEHIISMVNAGHGVSFGEKSPLYMEDTRISGVELVISKIVFKSGKVWKNEDNSTGETAEPAKPLSIPKNLKAQFSKEANRLRIQAKFQFEDFGGYWRCSCGMLNTGDVCCKCKATAENQRLVFSEKYLTKRLSEDIAEQRKQEYNKAVNLQKSQSADDLKEAVRIFESLSGYEDSAERIKKCSQRISEIEAEEATKEAQREKERQEQAERLAKATKKKKLTIGIVSGLAVVAVAFIAVLNTVIIPNNKYNNAISLYESGNYEEAKSAFKAMDGYKDSVDMIVDCDYGLAMALYKNGKYSLAKPAFQALGDYKDSADMIPECDYSMAMKSYKDGDYYYAMTVFKNLNGYKDSDSMIKSAQKGLYNEAMALVDSKEFSKARTNLEKIPDYENASEMIDLCKKQELYKSADADLQKDGNFKNVCRTVGRENFTEFMEEYGYTEELTKFQEDFKKIAGTYIHENPYGDDEYTIKINNSDWTFSFKETGEKFSNFAYSANNIEYEFEIGEALSFSAYSSVGFYTNVEINSKRDGIYADLVDCKKKK